MSAEHCSVGGRSTWGPPAATVGPRARLRQLWVPVAERAIRGSRRIISACGGRRDLCLLRDRDCAELAVNALFFIFAPPSDASAAERAPERASHIAVVCALGGGITGTLVSNGHGSRCFWMVNWLPSAQQRARASDECLPDQRSTALGRKKS